MTMEPASREQRARYDLAVAWQRKSSPVTEDGEDLLAARQSMEARHSAERLVWEARFARYLMEKVLPLEAKKKAAPPGKEEAALDLTG